MGKYLKPLSWKVRNWLASREERRASRKRVFLRVEGLEERILMTLGAPPSGPFPTGPGPVAVQVMPVNGDLFPDTVTANSDGTLTVALNNGDNYLRSVFTVNLGLPSANGLVLDRIDTDAFPDAIVQGPNSLVVTKNDGTGHFSVVQTLTPTAAGLLAPSGGGRVQLATGLLNGDAASDLVTVAPGTNEVLVYLNSGSGTFDTPIRFSSGASQPVAVAVGDFIGAPFLDLAIGHRDGTVTFFEGQGNGTFTARPDLTVQNLGVITGLATGDFLGNGNTEIAISSSTGVTLLQNPHRQAQTPTLVNGSFAGLTGWSATGNVLAAAGSAQLNEGSSFLTSLQQTFTVPTNPTTLSFNLTALGLESPAPASSPDAFEVSLLDGQSNSLVPTFRPEATSFINFNPGNVVSTATGVTDVNGHVTLDISHLTPGTQATLSFDLVGNPPGSGSTASIGSVQVSAAPIAETFTATALAGPFGSPAGIAAGDVDGDGKLDLVVSDSGRNSLVVYNGNGNGSGGFTRSEVSLSTFGSGPSGVATGLLTAGGAHADVALTLAGSNRALTPLVYDVTPPQVVSFTPANGQTLNTDIKQLQVRFSEAVQNNGPTGSHSVTNPAAYSLRNTTTNQAVAIAAVSYDAASFTATLVPAGALPLGDGTYQLVVNGTNATNALQDLAGNPLGGGVNATATFTVDKTAPAATLSFTPNSLWPPNHKLVSVHANLSLEPGATATLLSITANESGSGQYQGASFGTDDRDFQLLSERNGNGNGRSYTISYLVKDAAGNSRIVAGYVVVPHDQGHGQDLLNSLPNPAPGLGALQTSTVTQVNNQALTVGSTVAGSIAAAGTVNVYSFSGTAGQRLFFNALSGSATALHWFLTDPSGNIVFNSSFVDHDLLTLAAAGTYYLTVDARNSQTGSYAFKVWNVPATTTTAIALGQVVSGSIAVPGQTAPYTFSGTAGQRLFFDVENSAGAALSFTVLGPGNAVVLQASNQNGGNAFVLPSAGTYTIVVGHGSTLSATGAYQVQVFNDPVPAPQTVSQNTAVSGSISTPGQVVTYTFHGNLGQSVLVSPLSNPGNAFTFTLTDPSGNALFRGQPSSQTIASLPATGNYTLTVTASAAQTGNFSFQVTDQSSPPPVTGTTVPTPPSSIPVVALSGRNVGTVDYAHLQDVSGVAQLNFSRVTFNRHTLILYADAFLSDPSPAAVGQQVVVSFDRFTPPAAYLANPDAFAPTGQPVIVFGSELGTQGLQPGGTSAAIPLRFGNPSTTRFGFNVTLLAPGNVAPSFTSTPPTSATVGSAYSYTPTVSDANGDALTFRLTVAPEGMTVNAGTGALQWTPTASQAGNQDVTLVVSDGRGGSATQSWIITFNSGGGAPVNHAPFFVSTPVNTHLLSGQPFSYTAQAIDPDADPITYSLPQAPDGMTINAGSGQIDWSATGDTVQWASSVIAFSSQYTSGNWSAAQTLGQPDTFSYGDHVTAWSPSVQNGTQEYLTLGYTAAVHATGVTVRETLGNGFVSQVDLLDTAGVVHTIFTGPDSSLPNTPVNFDIQFAPTPYLVQGVKVYVDNNHNPDSYKEIDAVALHSAPVSPLSQWANAVIDFSTQYTASDWSAAQVLGASNTFSYGDSRAAWSPTSENGTQEFLTLGYAIPVHATGALVRETLGNGFVTQIDLLDTAGVLHTVFAGTDPSQAGTPADFTVTFAATPYLVQGIKVYVDTNHNLATYEEMDAVELFSDQSVPVTVQAADGRGGSATQSFAVTLSAAPAGVIQGTVFNDLNANGVRDPVPGPLFGRNLIVNGDAEAGAGSSGGYDVIRPIPGWTPDGNFTVIAYQTVAGSGFPLVSDPGPADRGANFFAGGPDNPSSGASQTIDVSSAAAAIDTGTMTFDLSAYLGGYFDQNDFATLTVTFRDAGGGALGSGSIGGVYLAERGGQTGLLFRETVGTVPAQTRSVDVRLQMTRQQGAYNDGYADNLSFVLFGPPEPGLAGWTVYADQNNNGRRDPGEPSAVTDANGQYTLSNLAPGTYTVREELQPGWSGTAPAAGFQVVTVGGTTPTVSGVDFGDYFGTAGGNHPPGFTSTAPTHAQVGQLYQYQATATDLDNDPLTFTLVQGPAGMAVGPSSGLVVWTPTGAETGAQPVILQVDDGRGGVMQQSFTVTVTASASTVSITSTPSLFATVGQGYSYTVIATDTAGQSITYSLLSAPTGMTINAGTGVISWTPGTGDLGAPRVTVEAINALGSFAFQSYLLSVRPVNTPPTVTSSPVTSVTAGATYRYTVHASDSADAFTFSLVNPPAGMSIDPVSGLILWHPGAGDIGPHSIDVRINDDRGAFSDQVFTLTVNADTEAPSVAVLLSAGLVNPGQTVAIQVLASDNIAVSSLSLTVNGTPLTLDSNQMATYTPAVPGLVNLVATATDPSHNAGTGTAQLRVFDPADVTPPVAIITSPTDGDTETYLTTVMGTVTDQNLDSYQLQYSLAGTEQWVTFATGSANVSNGVLGTFDPTLLQNDDYDLRIVAQDVNGYITFSPQVLIHLDGQAKLGNFHLDYTDLTIPVGNLPLRIQRSYDTLQASQSGDFGFGWQLSVADPRIHETVPVNPLEQFIGSFGAAPFRAGTKVYLSDPSGKRVGFTFTPIEHDTDPLLGLPLPLGPFWSAHFTPDPGVFEQLSVPDVTLQRNPDGTFGLYLVGLPYNPDDYTLTLTDGTVYRYNQFTGLQSITDRNGVTLTYTRDGLTSSQGGKTVQFVRDAQGRITQIIDPAGNSIRYGYDSAGNVTTVTDRTSQTTTYQYLAAPSHYLAAIIDPLGIKQSPQYDAQGRQTALIDGANNAYQFSYDLSNSTQVLIDPLGNRTTLVFDPRGNVITQVDAAGGITRRNYDANDNLLTVTDPLNRTQAFTFDVAGNVLSKTDALGNVWHWTYDAFARVLTATNPLGQTITNSYDSKGNLLSTTDAAGKTTYFLYDSFGDLLLRQDALGNQVLAAYDASGLLVGLKDALGNVTSFTYDANGNPLTYTAIVTTANGPRTLVSTATYDANGQTTSLTDADGHVQRTEYDADGRVSAEVDALGRRTQYTYDSRGLKVATLYADGSSEHFVYDTAGRYISTTDQLGRTTQLVYDALGRRVATIYPDGSRSSIEYDAAGQVTATVDERGNRTTFQYDAAGNRRVIVDALGGQTNNFFDAAGRQVLTTDARGDATRYVYDPLGRVVHTIFADGSSTSTTYDALGQRIAVTDQNGNTTHYEYDARGQLTAVVDTLGGRTTYTYDEVGNRVSMTDANGQVTHYEYDGRGRLVVTVLPCGCPLTTGYDAVGNIVTETDANHHSTRFTLDSRNRVVAEVDARGGTTTRTYDAAGQLTAVTDADGHTTRFEYDDRGRLVRAIDALGGVTQYAYDAAGNRTAVTDANGHTTHYTFDALGRLTATVDALGGVSAIGYDAVGNRTSMTDALGRTTLFVYNTVNRLIQQTDPNGGITRYTFDGVGNLLTTLDQLGNTTRHTYDPLGRQVTTVDALGGVTSASYDGVGNLIASTDALGRTTTYQYDNHNWLIAQTDPNGGITRYTYDDAGDRLTVTDPLGQTTSFEYDELNRLVRQTDPLGNSTTFSYDAVGNQTEVIDRDGRRRTFGFDASNRQTQETWWDGATVVRTISYAYDSVGNLLSESDPDSQYTFTYDVLNRPTSVDNAGTPGVPHVVLTATFDGVGNRTSVQDNSGVSVASVFDSRNQVVRESWSGGAIDPARVDLLYNLRGDRTEIDRFADLAGTTRIDRSILTPDVLGRLTHLEHRDAQDAVFANYDYAFDAAGQLAQEIINGQASNYNYDQNGQETQTNHAAQPNEDYAYDGNGNRTGNGYVTGPGNQVLSDGTFTYAYDGEGNLVRKVESATGNVTTYTYDYRNRLTDVEVKTSGGIVLESVQYRYDVQDRRIAKTVNGQTLYTVFDGDHAWADYNAAGQVVTRYLYGSATDEILARWRPGAGTVWYLADRLGSVRDLVNAVGALINHVTYNSFGLVLAQTNAAVSDRFLFTGREYDSEISLYYYRARFYDPQLGRFISHDPLGFTSGDLNLYRYVGNAPTFGIDPSGMGAAVEGAAELQPTVAIVAHVPATVAFVEGVASGAAIPAAAAAADISVVTFATALVGAGAVSLGAFATLAGLLELVQSPRKVVRINLQQGSGGGISDYTVDVRIERGNNTNTDDCRKNSATPSFVTGSDAEDYLALLYPGSQRNVQFMTGVVGTGATRGRRIDVLDPTGIARESKLGFVDLSWNIQRQIEKDAWLVRNRLVTGAVWHFFCSRNTGRIGADPAVLALLSQYRIPFVIHRM